MKLIHVIIKDKEKAYETLLKILDQGLKPSINTGNFNYNEKLRAIYFNLYNKKLIQNGINIVLNKNYLLNRDFYYCLSNNYESCINDEDKFYIKTQAELKEFNKKFKLEIKDFTSSLYNSLYCEHKNYKNILKDPFYRSFKHLHAYRFSHEFLITENISSKEISEIIFKRTYINLDILKYIKQNYPKIKITIL